MSTIHHVPRSTAGRVLVVGAGVSGLTSALCLARLGVEVDIVAEKFGSDLVSVVAGALWEWPPAVCGYHGNQKSLERSKAVGLRQRGCGDRDASAPRRGGAGGLSARLSA